MVPKEQRCILLDCPCRADGGIQPARRTASDLGGMPSASSAIASARFSVLKVPTDR
jgi:hypothetical protein